MSDATEPADPPVEAPDAPNPLFVRIDAVAVQVAEHLAKTRDILDQRLRYDQAKETVIDRMHEELLALRAEQAGKSIRPLAGGIIRLHSDLGRTAAALRTGPAPDAERLIRLLESFRDQAEILLAHEGIDTFHVDGDAFDGRRQQATARVPTAERERVGHVAERLRPGFANAHLVFEREAVAVYIAAPVVAASAVPAPAVAAPAAAPADPLPSPDATAASPDAAGPVIGPARTSETTE